ncbi:MAG: MBL fold metallo-hydrolase [candidate division Zixibacteria bacterium]|nr:MBL fold metallo-hydrolase [candidate division Zixibacteria bacterium]
MSSAQLTFLGATGTVTGSRYLVEMRGKKILIDCGLFQGPKENRQRNWEPFPVPPDEIDLVFLTHAHIDHIGYTPRFCRENFNGRIYCTDATNELSKILLRDSAHLQEEDAYWANKKGFSKHKPALPLFTVEDAEKALQYFSPLHYGEDLYLSGDFRIKFKDAGHILGSAMVDIKIINRQESRKIVFSGDLGQPGNPILRDPIQVYNVDYLIIESTYGDRLHEKVSTSDELARIIQESVKRGGVLLIPSFAVERTQVVLHTIRELEEKWLIPSLPVFVDSPMAIEATEVFDKRLVDQNLATRISHLEGKQIFYPQKLKFCRSREESKAINNIKKEAIIISSSGMATGGRVLHHLALRLPDPNNTIAFVGYQAVGTRGHHLVDGKPEVKIHGRQIPVNAWVENVPGFSGHADYHAILAWLMAFNRPPEKTFIVHGEPEASASLAEKIRSHFNWEVDIPELGDVREIEM